MRFNYFWFVPGLFAFFMYSTFYQYPSEDYMTARSVKLYSSAGSCSGVQVKAPSGISYILTAGHCNILASPQNTIQVETETHLILERRIVAEDPSSDLMLLEGVPNLKGLEPASEYNMKEDIMTFTHGKGYATYKSSGRLIQLANIKVLIDVMNEGSKVLCDKPKNMIAHLETSSGFVAACLLSVTEMASTAKIVPGSSGGMVVDQKGRLVGIASATGADFSMFVQLDDIRAFLSGY